MVAALAALLVVVTVVAVTLAVVLAVTVRAMVRDRAGERTHTEILMRAVIAKDLPDLTASLRRVRPGQMPVTQEELQSERDKITRAQIAALEAAGEDASRVRMPTGLDGNV